MSNRLTSMSIASIAVRALLVILVLLTVGTWAAGGAAVLLGADMVIHPRRSLLGNAAVLLFAAIPLVWLLGSTLPLAAPVPRIQDNGLAHQLGGLAAWTLVFAAVAEHPSTKRDRT